MSDVRSACLKVLRKTRPTELGYSYEDLKAMDDVSVNLLPEKKGMVFKHVEYLVESKVGGGRKKRESMYTELIIIQTHKSSVRRRYKDFEAYYDLLVAKYPYRLVPRLPPKKLNNRKEMNYNCRSSLMPPLLQSQQSSLSRGGEL